MSENGPIFVISDLHMGDGGSRDNFSRGRKGNREAELGKFLDYVCGERGELVIIGDLFEFWQANLSTLVVKRRGLLDRFAEMRAVYVVGNHDVDLQAFIGTGFLCHPFLGQMCRPFERTINGKRFRFMHGHEVDPFNCGELPSWGRMFSIFAGICEDAEESPFLPDGRPVEGLLDEFGELLLRLLNSSRSKVGKPTPIIARPNPKQQLTPAQNAERVEELHRKYREHKEAHGYDVAIVGHTHRPGRLEDWYYNSGSWAGQSNNFLRISASGRVDVFDWTEEGPVANKTSLNE